MSRKLSFDETEALRLYHERKTDGQIAGALHRKIGLIASWRKRRGLPSISIDPRKSGEVKCTYQSHQSYKEALSPEQTKEMGRFLAALQWYGDKVVKAGAKPDINSFINAWRDDPTWAR